MVYKLFLGKTPTTYYPINTMKKVKVSVFPLRNIVLYPQTHLPLIVQDINYIQLIKNACTENQPIAVGLGDQVKDKFGRTLPKLLKPKKIFALGKPELIETYDDGSVFVIIHGIGKCSLEYVLQQVPYLICEANVIEDTESKSLKLPRGNIHRLKRILQNWLNENIDDEIYLKALMGELSEIDQIINHICAFMVKDRETKQILLETYSLSERIKIINALFPSNSRFPDSEDPIVSRALKIFENEENEEFLLFGGCH